MVPEQESNPAPESTETSAATPSRRRNPARSHHRRGRGSRGRSGAASAAEPRSEAARAGELAEGTTQAQEAEQFEHSRPAQVESGAASSPAEAGADQPESVEMAPVTPAPPSNFPDYLRRETPKKPATVQQAIDDVTQVIEQLKGALDEMENVLEMLEIIERQADASDRELETLRRQVRQLHRPREGGGQHRSHSSQQGHS